MSIEKLISDYKQRIENNNKYIRGDWACEVSDLDYINAEKRVLKNVIEDLKGLPFDNGQKVKVPQFIADTMSRYNGLQQMLVEEYWNKFDDDKVQCWINQNFETVCMAGIFGYEVEEPKYYVKLPTLGFLIKHIKKDIDDELPTHYFINSEKLENNRLTCKLSESEIKDVDPRYWPFAVPVEKEVAE